MKRKDYRTPAMKVIQLGNRSQILGVSDGMKSVRSDYGAANSSVNSEELESDGTWEWN